MMKLIFKRMMIFYVALTLVASPVELLAAHKKLHKRIFTSQKNALIKHRISSRYKASSQIVSLRLRAARPMQPDARPLAGRRLWASHHAA